MRPLIPQANPQPSPAPTLFGRARRRRPQCVGRRLGCLSLAVSLLWGAALPGQSQAQPQPQAPSEVRLPALGESASDDFNLSQEKRVGEQIMREIRRDPDYLDDPPLLD